MRSKQACNKMNESESLCKKRNLFLLKKKQLGFSLKSTAPCAMKAFQIFSVKIAPSENKIARLTQLAVCIIALIQRHISSVLVYWPLSLPNGLEVIKCEDILSQCLT